MILFKLTFCFWTLVILLCAIRKIPLFISQILLVLGCVISLFAAIYILPMDTATISLPFNIANQQISFTLNAAALWLFGFGIFPALFACILSNKVQDLSARRFWMVGVSCALLGAFGVFGLQDGVSFLIAWELMGFGSALMLLAENKSTETGSSVLFMLALLEVGSVALLVAFLLLSNDGSNMNFATFAENAQHFSTSKQLFVGILLIIGFGAKLGLLPFYEWLPNAYSTGSGATGAIFSGVILNAAFFGLVRSLLVWLGSPTQSVILGIIVVMVGVLTAVLTILNAFQQTDWRRLLSLSSAENAGIAVTALGASLLFRQEQLYNLSALAGVVALIHIAAHSLAKGTLFIAIDGVFCSNNSYEIQQNAVLKKLGWLFGVGALFAVMSLSAMPPQAGFVSEWYVFQTIFNGFNLNQLLGKFTLIIAGIGIALTAAIGLATFVKAFGVGLLGAKIDHSVRVPFRMRISVFILGISILLLAIGMLKWIEALSVVSIKWFNFDAPAQMHVDFLLIPLSNHFAFISPTLLVIVTPILALLPIALIQLNLRYPIKRVPIWYGGLKQNPKHVATTAFTFANALHNFYKFIYFPKHLVTKKYRGKPYFIESLTFTHEITEVFRVYLFQPVVASVVYISEKIKIFQSGNLNFYNALIGGLFILILLVVMFF